MGKIAGMESSVMSERVTVLIDHNIELQAALLWNTLRAEGWLKLYPLDMVMFEDLNLDIKSNDREIWHYSQKNRMVLLTANRNMEDTDSLEQTLRESNMPDSLPVITISRQENIIKEAEYRKRCAEKLLEIMLYLNNYLGVGRVFIP